uniref:Rhodopsin domain-containing protein n=1 Tax=Gibberella zeae TaxID=5518 RepID=A0A4E9EFX4_GIBZA
MDFYILGIPITTIWSLQMTLRRKITVLSVLVFGIVSLTVALIRLPILESVTSSMESDVSIDVGKMVIVAAFEVQCAIVAMNLPWFKALWVKIKGRQSTSDRNAPSAQQPYKLSSMNNKHGSRKNNSMGVVTLLERGLTTNESEEALVNMERGQVTEMKA